MRETNQRPKSPVRELIALTLVHNLGKRRIRLLLQAVDRPQEIFRLEKPALEGIEEIGSHIADAIRKFNGWDRVDEIISDTRRTGARILTFLDDDYPDLLRQLYDPPTVLWVKGSREVLNSAGIAVVGTRRATDYGLRHAAAFSKELVENGLTVVSGLAYGVDAAAHRATLKAGGRTIAVLGSGIDNVYPARHRHLADEIAESGGAVISEYIPGTKPDAGNFPERNRIVSGLTLGTLVVESGLKGGSMITARSALDQNREVFVVPHPLDTVNGRGCNAIIKRGWGKLVHNIEDIMVEIPVALENRGEQAAGSQSGPSGWQTAGLEGVSLEICKLLEEHHLLHIDEISEKVGLPTQEVLSTLLELEMADCIRQTAGKRFELF